MSRVTVYGSGSVTGASQGGGASNVEVHHAILAPTGSNVQSLTPELVGPVFRSQQLTGVNLVVAVVGSTSAALMIGKCTGSTPAGSATPLLSAVVMIQGSADQVYNLTPGSGMINSAALQTMKVNDRLVGTITGAFEAPASILVGFNMLRF